MNNFVTRLSKIKQDIAPAELIVVSKYRSINQIIEVYNAGQRIFAENRVQALLERIPLLPTDIKWHLIGSLQRNKVKSILPFVSLIHSVDSMDLLAEINKQALKLNLVMPILLQIHVAQEQTKQGFDPSNLIELVNNKALNTFLNIQVCGLMAMASNVPNPVQIASEFAAVNHLFKQLKPHFTQAFSQLSMGMSGDFKIAVQNGSTAVRIGTAVFED